MADIENIFEECPELHDWIKSITRYGEFEKFVIVEQEEPGNSKSVRVKLWTDNNSYSISASLPVDGYDGYLGCIASARKPRVGEDWTRGNDLADGPYSIGTWRKIVNGIVAYELSKLEISVQLPADEEAPVLVGEPIG